MDESRLEQPRQHERVGVADREAQRRANVFLAQGESTNTVRRPAARQA